MGPAEALASSSRPAHRSQYPIGLIVGVLRGVNLQQGADLQGANSLELAMIPRIGAKSLALLYD
jgi:hypothetical protein